MTRVRQRRSDSLAGMVSCSPNSKFEEAVQDLTTLGWSESHARLRSLSMYRYRQELSHNLYARSGLSLRIRDSSTFCDPNDAESEQITAIRPAAKLPAVVHISTNMLSDYLRHQTLSISGHRIRPSADLHKSWPELWYPKLKTRRWGLGFGFTGSISTAYYRWNRVQMTGRYC